MNIPYSFYSLIKSSKTIKLLTIALMIIFFLIPLSMIESIIFERQALSEDAFKEVSGKWSNSQVITGPILTIPLTFYGHGKEEMKEEFKQLRILPSTYEVSAQIEPVTRKRGIYKVILYTATVSIKGKFEIPDIKKEGLKEINWSNAFLSLGLTDLRGVRDKLMVEWGGNTMDIASGSSISSMSSGVTISDLGVLTEHDECAFEIDMILLGSQSLEIVPMGNQTDVRMSSIWPSPSFVGKFLPVIHDISTSGFEAHWKVNELNRNYPGQWYGDSYFNELRASAFGVTLFEGAGHYQKAIRSAKYGIMIIALTFLVFLLVELLYTSRVHPFQYTLIGLALTLFFALLVALSEHIDYNMAYIISASSIIVLISLYTRSVLGSWKMSGVMALGLTGIYTFLFFTLGTADYALLMGSVGLTIILAMTMYFTRNVNWYGD